MSAMKLTQWPHQVTSDTAFTDTRLLYLETESRFCVIRKTLPLLVFPIPHSRNYGKLGTSEGLLDYRIVWLDRWRLRR